MNLCLAFLMQNDEHWLTLHLPVYLASGVFQGVVAVDGGSTDGSVAYVESVGGKVYARAFDNDFGAQGNFLIECCEREGYDALYRADPDEIVRPDDLRKVRAALEKGDHDLFALSRRHFVGDRKHVHPTWFPDSQWRAWMLNRGIRYKSHLKVHEIPHSDNARPFHLEDVVIDHFGYTISPSERAYKIAWYDAIEKGLPLPNKADFAHHPPLDIPRIPFQGSQPLNPDVIGIHAPFAARDFAFMPSTPLPRLQLSANATGDRTIEYGWTLLNIPLAFGGKRALDFGSGGVATLSERCRDSGWTTDALDYEAVTAPTGVHMVTGDVLTLDLPTYDLIINCSSIEHVGLAGRYGVVEQDDDGDLKAMRKLRDALAPGGLMLLTTPVGRDWVHKPMHRIYGSKRLNLLLEGFEILSETFYKKLPDNSWTVCSRADALATYTVSVTRDDWRGVMFNLGAFALRKTA